MKNTRFHAIQTRHQSASAFADQNKNATTNLGPPRHLAGSRFHSRKSENRGLGGSVKKSLPKGSHPNPARRKPRKGPPTSRQAWRAHSRLRESAFVEKAVLKCAKPSNRIPSPDPKHQTRRPQRCTLGHRCSNASWSQRAPE